MIPMSVTISGGYGSEKHNRSLDAVIAQSKRRKEKFYNVADCAFQQEKLVSDFYRCFSQARAIIYKRIDAVNEKLLWLFETHCDIAYDRWGEPLEYTLYPPEKLEALGYYEKRQECFDQLREHRENIRLLKEHREIAQIQTSLIQNLIEAHAETAAILAAQKDLARSVRFMAYYAATPDFVVDRRRLRVMQWSVEQAQKRTERYIEQTIAKSPDTVEQYNSMNMKDDFGR